MHFKLQMKGGWIEMSSPERITDYVTLMDDII